MTKRGIRSTSTWTGALCAWLCALGWAIVLPAHAQAADGNAAAGRIALAAFDCGVCHRIPGVRGARGVVGPTLSGFGLRSYIAGRLPNTDATLVRFIVDPPALVPDTAMPAVGVSEAQARDMAAYLRSLR